MTQIQWQQLESMIGAMTPGDKQRLVTMLSARMSETPPSADDAVIKMRERARDAQAQIADSVKELAAAIVPHAGSTTPAEFLLMSRDQQLEFLRRIASDRERLAEDRRASSPSDAEKLAANDSFIGCMADESDLLDEIMESVYHDREHLPFRAAE